jgi:hypothetical protein
MFKKRNMLVVGLAIVGGILFALLTGFSPYNLMIGGLVGGLVGCIGGN